MSSEYHHISVLPKEVLEYLNPQPNKLYLDATFGGGGHTKLILEREPKCRVVALDWDQDSLLLRGEELQKQFPDRLQLVWGNFALLYKILKKEGICDLDGVIADIGTSQHQITKRHGFSFLNDTPLDMRMSPAHQRTTAADVINKSSEEAIRQILWQLGEERYAKQIVAAIARVRKQGTISTTKQLAEIVRKAVPSDKDQKIHPATKVFQALRIYINKELENLRSFLPAAARALRPSGRLVVISFHSLEDRIVKHFLKGEEQKGSLEILTPRAIKASQDEIVQNPSARSARLRAAMRR